MGSKVRSPEHSSSNMSNEARKTLESRQQPLGLEGNIFMAGSEDLMTIDMVS